MHRQLPCTLGNRALVSHCVMARGHDILERRSLVSILVAHHRSPPRRKRWTTMCRTWAASAAYFTSKSPSAHSVVQRKERTQQRHSPSDTGPRSGCSTPLEGGH